MANGLAPWRVKSKSQSANLAAMLLLTLLMLLLLDPVL